ncbi:MAG: ferrous iron transport protein B [Lachnospiraceae bacterium]
MNAKSSPVIALLGQPNSGKSTLFNMLTGSRQHVGNWPGKTVEQKDGKFVYNNTQYVVTDLPGSYSLSANSDEEIVTRDYIASGKADLVCVLADASQLERSLYMLAEYAGIETPAILLLNMIDVAQEKGVQINPKELENKLGIPVIPFVAADRKEYARFYSQVEKAVSNPQKLRSNDLFTLYEKLSEGIFKRVYDLMPAGGIDQYSAMWLTVKILEGDEPVMQRAKADLSSENRAALEIELKSIGDGNLLTGNCKFQWIDELLAGAVKQEENNSAGLSKFDKLATSRRWSKLIAIGIIILGLIIGMIPAVPFKIIGQMFPTLLGPPLRELLTGFGVHAFLVSFICDALLNALYMALAMVGFVIGITFSFGLLEEVGYMARISYAFDDTMSRLGLQGKSIMPFLVSIGCTIAGTAGTRVIDSWGQRVLTISLAWAVPCASTLAVIPTLATVFFGWGPPIVIIAIFGVMLLHMFLTAKIFGRRLVPEKNRYGMIMELPPYHKPRWGTLLRYVFNRGIDIFWRALKVILVVSALFWLMTYSNTGSIQDSIIYTIGTFIEPVTQFFGLGWKNFMAFLSSGFAKEAILGVLSALYSGSGSVFDSAVNGAAASASLNEILADSVSKAEGLAFIFATTFNVPCVMAVAATYQETHSLKWTFRMILYYVCTALAVCFIIYHIGLLIF